MLIWDNLNTHISAAMRQMIDAWDWLTVIGLPAYAPDLNPTEAVWSHLKRSVGNLAVTGVDHLLTIIRTATRASRTAPTRRVPRSHQPDPQNPTQLTIRRLYCRLHPRRHR